MDPLGAAPLWDLSLPPSLPALADEEFIALLQKQFGANNGLSRIDDDKEAPPPTTNINPQNLTRLPIPRPVDSPPSDDSSPSPNEANVSRSRRESGVFDLDDADGADEDPSLKRKAGEEDLGTEPSLKTQHTSPKKGSASRRKSTGNPTADDSRLLKRKEQNRAAQRAFRERKEKHVKDLEDKVAALEEKNAAAIQENESLREVVSHLQSENMRLRQSSFTFAVPPSASTASSSQSNGSDVNGNNQSNAHRDSQTNTFNIPPSTTTSSTASTHDSPESLFLTDNSDGQLSFLGRNLIPLSSEQQQTATADAMNMDFGFGPVLSHTPYTTIASNPLFMSFREPDVFDSLVQQQQQQQNHGQSAAQSGQSYDFSQQLFPGGWPDVAMNNGGSPNTSMQAFDLTNSLDELFGTSYNNGSNGLDYTMNAAKASPSTSLSPVSHRNSEQSTPGASSSSSSPSVSGSPVVTRDTPCDPSKKCTKSDLAKAIALDKGSIFAARPQESHSEDSSPSPPKSGTLDDDQCDEFPPCKGLQLPKTQKNENNVEVMAAWRKIRHDPKFQDIDINQLCTEFASKARCDGCHVVIEPSGMQEILDSVSRAKREKQQSALFSASNSAGLFTK
ncbi:uncharacterized protein FOMMEDRAFT_140417 [Fomitiporia mediterranea MF3/22]|uniref:uncharacterized protein n=1 Tax=Fomitiporia mediterranea (strain MF3/22) TaxID=694068 RepID=UPI000440757E|nr:uncharacterized protein FOMMEDRAFT_140417 [Fomitiporia mediterranea MF3/22]EJD04473.1 hypothetical protein FOMMEDRAFT_140417 [Fomitiporia mediterranea MF3/22]